MGREYEDVSSGSPFLYFLGGLGLGALFMYLTDPDNGRRRRALIRDQYAHASRTVRERTEAVVHDAANRVSGVLTSAQSRLEQRGKQPDESVLGERVRAALGRATSHPGAIQVTAVGATVTLSGDALASEIEDIVACARDVPGVEGVENRVNVYDSAQNIPSLQGASRVQ